MQSQFLNTNEVEHRCEEALESKFCELRNELWRAESLRSMTLAKLQTVQTELNLKRSSRSLATEVGFPPAIKCRGPRFR